MDEKKAGLGKHYPALRAGLLLIVGGAIALGYLQYRTMQEGGFAEDVAFAGYVVTIDAASGDVRIESAIEEAELSFPSREVEHLRIGDVLVKEQGEQGVRLFREGQQAVPSDFWISEPAALPAEFAASLEEARRAW